MAPPLLTVQYEAATTYVNIIFYAISYQLQRPVEPFLVRSLINTPSTYTKNSRRNNFDDESQRTNQTYGRLTSLFSLIQTVGSPIVGTLLDRIGPRKTSILVYGASALGYWMLSHATTPGMLYWSKVPMVLQHAFLVGQATVSRSCNDSNHDIDAREGWDSAAQRAAALGRMTTAYTIGATIGPALGGILAVEQQDLYVGARLAVWGSMVSLVLSLLYLKDHTDQNVQRKKKNDESPFKDSLSNTLQLLLHPKVSPLLLLKFLNGISSSAFNTILPLLLANRLHLPPSYIGYLMSASSLSVAIFAALGISPAMKYLGRNNAGRLAIISIAMRAFSLLIFAIVISAFLSNGLNMNLQQNTTTSAQNPAHMLSNNGFLSITAAAVLISLFSHIHATSLTTLTTGAVSTEKRGALLGLEHGFFAMARVVGPPMGTWLLSDSSLEFSKVFLPKSLKLSDKSSNYDDGRSRHILGLHGLWNVVMVCVVLDFVLMVCLNLWSTRQCTKSNNLDLDCAVYDQLVVEHCNDHEHSD
ncbi:hypothetical protein ACHAXS_006389 [Conticribra weissflogii]